MKIDVAVIGGALSGLAVARALRSGGVDDALFEAKDRLGGASSRLR